MRRGLAIVVGFACVSPAIAQFAADRTPPPAAPPAVPAGFTPQPQPLPQTVPQTQPSPAPASPPTTPSPIRTVSATTAPATPPTAHPWYVKPEHGAWMICIKSYRDDTQAGVSAKAAAEELATEIRQNQKAAAYLFEWGAEERAKENARREAYRDKVRREYAPFLDLREQMKKKADAQGTEFMNTAPTVRVPTVEYAEQYAVLVGGFKDMETARKALDTVRKWTPPKGKDHLLDRAVITGEKGATGAYINPYTSAMVVPNPAVRRTDPAAPPPVDPLLAKLNEGEEFSLLKCKKPVTLCVKVFSVPTRTTPKDAEPGSMISKMFAPKQGNVLDATALQAHELAAALRNPKMKPRPFEAYVLHARTGSLVCVGGFDGGDDPDLAATGRTIQSITFQELDKSERPTGTVHRMFDHVFAMPIPRGPQP